MKNIVGQTPRGKNFYQRDKIIEKIYRRLDGGNHIFMSAPRRAGKTSIMRFMEDNPRKRYAFVYVSVEDVDNLETYFRILSEELLASAAVGKLLRASKKAKSVFEEFSEHVKSIKVFNLEIETQEKEPKKYSVEFENLMRKLDTSTFKIVILVDEFPVALERIAKEFGTDDAVEFLHTNRSIRQRAKSGIQFIYTGSIGLPNIARKLKATATINDLNVVEVPPLSHKDALEFTQQLLEHYKVIYSKEALKYMLKRLRWLMPFFIQLVVQMLIDEFESNNIGISEEIVDSVLEQASNHRNNIYFENYYSRLDKSLSKSETLLAKKMLMEIAKRDMVPLNHFDDLEEATMVLEILEFDGYINSTQKFYSFNSPILQHWWKKNASSG